MSPALMSLFLVKTYVYYMDYSDDALAMKIVVAAIWKSGFSIPYMPRSITSYGVPTNLEYIIWFVCLCSPESLPTEICQVIASDDSGKCIRDFYRSMLLCASNILPLSLSYEVVSGCPSFAIDPISDSSLRFANPKPGVLAQIMFSGVTPALATVALTEVLITVSLCILFYDSGSGSAFPRTKRLMNTLIIYAVNRCLLTSLVALADLIVFLQTADVQDTWSIALEFVVEKLYANSLLASLNSREHLRSKGAGTLSDLRISAVHLANPPQLPGNVESSTDGAR
ncbi:hypothetical protein F5J12DRAFT_785633 [Pisolithus orientalis]|uniref:uncharacterized protein n=1 Tax=Pisolithus orientalis TaxID=936130 RepID=UPI00222476FD|nr:uncharacterized protein F5J12DRAFT_785633 [Pisolithus orientalis]KAI5995284.1 hypothetical protein F5J12DRAFT_785633 [Pisolithus orientalis]